MKHLLLIFLLAITFTGFSQSPVKAVGYGVAEVEEVVYFSSIRQLIPGKPWELVVQEHDISEFSKLFFNYAEFPDYPLERVEVLRKGNKHIFTQIKAKGRMACELMLEDAFRVFGDLNQPKINEKNKLLFEWNIDDNFADQHAEYLLIDKKYCTVKISVNY